MKDKSRLGPDGSTGSVRRERMRESIPAGESTQLKSKYLHS